METRNKENRNRIARNVALVMLGLISIAALTFSYIQYDQKNEYVAKALAEKEASELYVMDAFTRIENNLSRIRTHEGLIRESLEIEEDGNNLNLEDRIHSEIRLLEQLLDENEQIIAGLNEELDSKNSLLSAYEKSIRELKGRIDGYKITVDQLAAEKEALRQELTASEEAKDNLAQKIVTLSEEVQKNLATIDQQEQAILERENALNTAYYTVGSYKELRDKEVVHKEGGIFGIASAKTVGNELDPAQFQMVDIREVSEIPIRAGHADILTSHDPASFNFEFVDDRIESIRITDPARFWEKSKYLVVVVRDAESGELASAR